MVDPSQILDSAAANNPYYVENLQKLVNSSITGKTWGKYTSAFNAFKEFEEASLTVYPWPLSITTCRAFAVWGRAVKKWQHSTIKNYLSGLRFIHHAKGLQCDHLCKDPILDIIVRGAEHANFSNPGKSPTRRVVTFPVLILLTHRIAISNWDKVSKQVIYTAALTAFFTSTRLGELLASSETQHASASDLTWNDVLFMEGGSVLLRIKQPKSGAREGEYVDLFLFPGNNCCPVKAITKLKERLIQAGVFHMHKPVFCFRSGLYLTKAKFNSILAGLLSDVCVPGLDTISGHSF